MTAATSAYGTLFKRGDGGSGAAVKASRTMGAGNSQLVIEHVTAGTAGNAYSVEIVVSGASTALAVAYDSTTKKLTITAETDGASAAVSTVNDIIAKIYQTAAAAAVFDATDGAGDGTGVIAAAATDFLASGAAGGEAFTTVAEVTSISGPSMSTETIDVTSMDSASATREFIASLKDGGEVSLEMNFLPATASQNALITDWQNRTLRNFQIIWTDSGGTTWAFAGIVTNVEPSGSVDDKLALSVTIKVSGTPTFS